MKLKGLYQKHGVWWFQGPQVQGVRPKPVSLGTKDEREAMDRYFERLGEARAGLVPSKASFELKRYLAAKALGRKHTARSAEIAELAVRLFIKAAGDRMVQDYTLEEVARWRDWLFAQGKSESTVLTYLSRVRAWFNWLVRERLVSRNPVQGVDLPGQRRTRANFYCTKAERDRLLEAALERPDVAFVVWSGFMAGLRKQEIIEARSNWFDLEGGVMEVQVTPTFQPKGRHLRTIELSPRYVEFLRGYGMREPFMVRPEVKKGRARYRWDFRRPFVQLVGSEGLDWVRPHMMRRTFATLHVMAGTQIPLVAKWLGDDEKVTYDHYFGYARAKGNAGAAD